MSAAGWENGPPALFLFHHLSSIVYRMEERRYWSALWGRRGGRRILAPLTDCERCWLLLLLQHMRASPLFLGVIRSRFSSLGSRFPEAILLLLLYFLWFYNKSSSSTIDCFFLQYLLFFTIDTLVYFDRCSGRHCAVDRFHLLFTPFAKKNRDVRGYLQESSFHLFTYIGFARQCQQSQYPSPSNQRFRFAPVSYSSVIR